MLHGNWRLGLRGKLFRYDFTTFRSNRSNINTVTFLTYIGILVNTFSTQLRQHCSCSVDCAVADEGGNGLRESPNVIAPTNTREVSTKLQESQAFPEW